MELKNIVVAEAHVELSLTLTETKNLIRALDNSELSYDSQKQDEVDYHSTIMMFYEFLSGVVEGLEQNDQ